MPTFGNDSSEFANLIYHASTGGNDCYYRGLWGTTGNKPGTADSITIKLGPVDSSQEDTLQCALYEYVDYSTDYAGALIGSTESIVIQDDWDETEVVFTFSDPKPQLSANTNYYIIVFLVVEDISGGSARMKGYEGVGLGIYDSQSDGFTIDNPLTGEIGTANIPYIYCTYTEKEASSTVQGTGRASSHGTGTMTWVTV